MADGTVRGGFELETAGAVRGLRSIRDTGREADLTMQNLGRRMDSLASTSTRVMGQVSSSWAEMRRRIDDNGRQIEARIDRLELKLDSFSRRRVTATVELSGFDRVNAQLTELELRLDRLGARSVTSRVSMGGGFGGGGQGLVAGGPGSPMFSSIGGMAGRLPWWALAAPLAPTLLGAAGGLLGSASSAALGAGAVGIGGAGALGLGGGLSMLVGRSAITPLAGLMKAQQTYDTAIATYGRNSAQARTARLQFAAATAGAPQGAVAAARQVTATRQAFTTATAPGRSAFYAGISQAAYNVRGAMPSLGTDANIASTATAAGAVQLSRYLTNPAALSQYRQLTQSFSREMPTMVSTVGNLVRVFGNLAVAATPFFHEADTWVNRWTTGLRVSTGDTTHMRVEMEKMVTSAKDWGRMLGAGGRVMKDLLSAGRPSGDSMVVQFTNTLDRWDTWLRDNPGKVRQFMADGERGFSRIATVVGNLTHDIWSIFQGLSPILTRAEQFMQFASGLGGGSLLTGGALLYGAYGGARGALGGGGPSAGGVARSFIFGSPAGLMGGRMGGGAVVGASPAAAMSRSYLLAPRAFQAGGMASMAGDQLPLFAAAGGAYAYRSGGGPLLRGARGEGAFQAAYGNIEGARGPASVITSELGAQSGMIARAGTALRGAAAGAARFIVPLAAIQALAAGLGSSGGVPHAIGTGLSTGLSTLTLGTVSPGAVHGLLHSAFGTDNAGASFGSPGAQASVRSIGAQAAAVRTPAQLRALQARTQGVRLQYEMSPADSARLTAFLRQASATAASNAGAAASNTWEDAFQRGIQNPGHSPRWAVSQALRGIPAEMKALGPQGSRAFAQDTAAWAAQMAKDNPALQRPLDHLMGGIIGNLNKLSGHVRGTMRDIRDQVFYFNGQILTGSTATWQKISSALTDPSQVALEKLTGIWGAINSEAITALTQMGFSHGEAAQIVRMTGKGGSSAAAAGGVVSIATSPGGNQLTSRHPKRERGGMIGGQGLLDTVRTPDGGYAAPGEAWIANRHTMMDLSSATLEKYGKTAWEMIRDEGRPHSAPPRRRSFGGLVTSTMAGSLTGQSSARGSTGWVQRQHPELHPGIAQAVEAVINRFPLSITSTTRGGHAGGSYHYLGEAADIAGTGPAMLSASDWIKSSGLARSLTEGIHNPNLSYKFGQPVGSGYWGATTWAAHANHIHMAVAGALNAYSASFGGGGGAMRSGAINLTSPGSGLRGIPGALADRAGSVYAAALQQRINGRIGGGGAAGGISAAGFSGGGSAGANQALGHRMMLSAGWGESEWPSLLALWNQESGWNANAVNPGSGAYGIPQALGHGRPFALGDAPGQIAWGLNYIRSRYGSPSAAEGHERGYGWYQRGGHLRFAGWNERGGSYITNGATVFGAGEKGRRERVTISPLTGGRGNASRGGINVQMIFHGGFTGSAKDIDRVGREVAAKILEALDHGQGEGTSDADLLAGASA